MTKPTLGKTEQGSVAIDTQRLVETRLLVQANSGGGKSWALRRLLEQTAGDVQQLVIDPEGEFATLRERHDFVIAAAHDGDAVANPRTAALLATRLLESGVSAILDIYDLKAYERQAFVQAFLNALITAPKRLWHPVLIILDEAHTFAPQVGNAAAAGAVADVATRGRKRGQCLVCATQRLSKLHKDVAAELLNKLIGRTSLDVDVKRAADELGMSGKEAAETLRRLQPGEFFAFGPALVDEVQRMTVGDVRTTHPKSGQRMLQAPPAPSRKVMQTLAQLADLEQEAASGIHDLDTALQRIQTLERELAKAPAVETKTERIEVPVVSDEQIDQLDETWRAAAELVGKASGLVDEIRAAMVDAKAIRNNATSVRPRQPVAKPLPSRPSSPAARPTNPSGCGSSLGKAERSILTVLAQHDGCEKTQLALLAGYSAKGGGFNNALSSLRSSGFLEGVGNGVHCITDAGLEALGPVEALPSGEQLRDYWLGRCGGKAERAILEVLFEAYPDDLPKTSVADAAGYAATGGGFNNALSKLRTLKLITGSRELRAADSLF